MRILMISPLCPLPLEKGGAIRIWNIAKQLAASHQVDLICFIRDAKEREYEEELHRVFRNVHFVKRKEIASPRLLLADGWQKLRFFSKNLSLLKDALFSRRPLLSILYDHPDVLRYVQIADAEREYDLMYCETYYAGASLVDDICRLRTPFFLCEQNVESEVYRRQAAKQQNFFIRCAMFFDIWKLTQEEKLFWKRVPFLGGLSPVDVAMMKDASEREDLVLIENGVDVSWFSESRAERNDNEILFVGSFSYFPNVDALKWLVDEIWPTLCDRIETNMKPVLRIVGRGADKELIEYIQSRGHHIDDSVDDIREAFQRATLLVAPLRAGSGTKYKVLEAMASYCPVITTSVGAEGLSVSSGKELLIADSAGDIVEAIISELHQSDKRLMLSKEAFAFVKERYDWSKVVPDIRTLLRI